MGIHLITGNSYKALRNRLIEQLQTEFNRIVTRGGDPVFTPIPIVTSAAIGDDICRTIASGESNICIGLRFDKLNKWLKDYGSLFLRGTGIDRELDWLIWSILKEKRDSGRYEPFEKRLQDYCVGKNDRELFVAAEKISGTFVEYLNYRTNWVFEWLGLPGTPDNSNLEEAKKHPDYFWQVQLWKEIQKRLTTGEKNKSAFLQLIENFAYRLYEQKPADYNPDTIPDFFFLPETVPPLGLPFIEKAAATKDVYVYLMRNTLSDYSLLAGTDSYTERNATQTARLIERFERFNPNKPLQIQLTGQKTHTAEILDALSPTEDTLLTRVQQAVWNNRAPDFSGLDMGQDKSIRLGKASSLAREIETVVDWIFAIKAIEGDALTSEDILVLMPDVTEAAPMIEGIMATLPPRYELQAETNAEVEKQTRIAYNILGATPRDASQLARAFFGITAFLNSGADFDSFTQLLRFKAIEKAWRLSAQDSATATRWLSSAGFLSGLDEEHLRSLVRTIPPRANYLDSDGTLERALERLMLGDALGADGLQTYSDVRPVDGTEMGGFDKVQDNLAILTSLCNIFQAMKTASKGIFEPKTGAEWLAWTRETLQVLFPGLDQVQEFQEDYSLLSSTAVELANAQNRVLLEEQTLDFDAWIRTLEHETAKHEPRGKPYGSVMFASIASMRWLPKKAIALIGMDDTALFPGSNKEEEFSLLAIGDKRLGDGDSRSENRNRFLDAILSAEKYLFIGYNAGADPKGKNTLNPSSVVQDLFEWMTSNGFDRKMIEFPIPLMRYSEEMFSTKRGARFWNGHDRIAGESHLKALQSGYSAPVPAFIDTLDENLRPITGKSPKIDIPKKLRLADLVQCWTDPDKFLEKMLRLGSYSVEESRTTACGIPCSDNNLFLASAKRRLMGELDSHHVDPNSLTPLSEPTATECPSLQAIKDYILASPQFGAEGVRFRTTEALIAEIFGLYKEKATMSPQGVERNLGLSLPLTTKTQVAIELLIPGIPVCKNDPSVALVTNFSQREALNNTMTHIARCACGESLSLVTLDWDAVKESAQKTTTAPIAPENAKAIMDALFSHYQKTLERILVTTQKEHYSQIKRAPKVETLFRGRDELKETLGNEKADVEGKFDNWLLLHGSATQESLSELQKKIQDAQLAVATKEGKLTEELTKRAKLDVTLQTLSESLKTAKKPDTIQKKIDKANADIVKQDGKIQNAKDAIKTATSNLALAENKYREFEASISAERMGVVTNELCEAIRSLGESAKESHHD